MSLLYGEPEERSLCSQQLSSLMLLLQVRCKSLDEAEKLSDLQLQNQKSNKTFCSLGFFLHKYLGQVKAKILIWEFYTLELLELSNC